MKLLSSWFLPAMALSSASASASVQGAGRFMAAARAMERGTMESTSARREASPMTDSMSASSCASMPMWRGRDSVGFFRADKAAGAVMGPISRMLLKIKLLTLVDNGFQAFFFLKPPYSKHEQLWFLRWDDQAL